MFDSDFGWALVKAGLVRKKSEKKGSPLPPTDLSKSQLFPKVLFSPSSFFLVRVPAFFTLGAYQVVYNCTALSHKSCFQDAPGATNWIIGFKGEQTNTPEFQGRATSVMAANASVEPRSLYWAQLIARMGGDAERVEHSVGSLAKNQCPPRL